MTEPLDARASGLDVFSREVLRWPSSLQEVRHVLYLALGFLLPLSGAAITVLFIALAVLSVAQGGWRDRFAHLAANPLNQAIGAFFLLHVLALGWAEDPTNAFKSWKLFLVPLLMAGVASRTAEQGVWAFLLGMGAAALGSYVKLAMNLDAYQAGNVGARLYYVEMNHISYSPLLALAIAALLLLMLTLRWTGLRRGLVLVALALLTVNLFLTGGRAGQVALFFSGLFIGAIWLRRNLAGLMLVLVLLCGMFASAYALSPMFKSRMDAAVAEAASYQVNRNTSLGLRLTFAQNAWALVQERPLLGHGTGGFAAAYARINAERTPALRPTDNPHNHHLLTLVQFGVIGFAVYLSIFLAQLYLALRMPDGFWLKPLALLLPLFFIVISFSESYLWVHYTQAAFAYLSVALYRPGRAEESV